MPTIFPTAPHFDDFDQTKQFVRILFRPGRAVQARELTQLQTIIQSQVERFGKGIYKDGSFITPPETTFDNTFSFVKLTETTGATTSDDVIAGLVGQEITNADGVKALIVDSAVSTTAGDPPTLFVKYQDGGSNKALAFSDGDTLTSGSTTLTAIASSATGDGTAFSVGQSVVFAKGNFLFVNKQTEILSKYGDVDNIIIGFNITESVVDSDVDESLLDPATGTFNFFAPGADRYKANLILGSRDLEFESNTNPNFVEIARVDSGEIVTLKDDPQLSALGDILARRTYEESGNYIVDRFDLQLFEHLRTTSPANSLVETRTIRDGIFTAAEGGDANIFVAKVNTGKAYVRGYEVENFNTIFLNIFKARDNTDTISSVVPTSLSSFVKVTDVDSIPEFEDIITLSLKDEFKSGNIATNGDEVGTAKARGLIYLTGNVAPARGGGEDRTAEFELHLFDINMNSGSEFERDVKQIASTNSYTNFSANIVPVTTQLSGGVTFNDASTTVRGSGTRFTTELKVGDVFNVSNTQTTDKLIVSDITDDVTLTVSSAASINLQLAPEVTYATFTRDGALINDADKDILVFKLPADNIRNIDDSVVTYSVKRQFTGITLSSGATTLGPLDAGENFAPFSTDNYVAVITSGARAGELIPIISSQVSRDTGARTIEFDFSTEEGLTSETVTIYTTVTKGTGAGSRLKTKTLATNQTIDFISEEDAQKSVISLGKADGFKLNSVLMANVETSFGSVFNTDRTTNITNRYLFDTGQKSSFYDVAKIRLKPGQAKPAHPIRVNFDFFTHSNSGDYFDVSSYSGIDYENIPSTILGGKEFQLRDCIDFRPRINDAGTGFTGTGAPTNQPLFLDPEVDFTLNFRHYLPKISTIALDETGTLIVYDGISQLNPSEPQISGDLLKLFVLEQDAYVFNLIDNIRIRTIPHKRFTMKDIGKIENRVKTLEYYTSLNLLERDAEQTQIQDSLGFDRFKNGFLVDSFTGHGVGDSIDNPDYATSVNFKKREAAPLVKSEMVDLVETSTTTSQRTSNNYVLTGEIFTLPFTEEAFIRNQFSSRTNNLNPFNLSLFQGITQLDPPGDIFFDDSRVPDKEVDRLGTYDSLSSQSLIKKDGKNIFGSIADIEQFNQGTTIETEGLPDNLKTLAETVGALSPDTTTVETTGNEVVKILTVKPKMRTVTIGFTVSGLRPNTNMHAFFDELRVTNFCRLQTAEIKTAIAAVEANSNAATRQDLANAQVNSSNVGLFTDSTGSMSGVFFYDSETLELEVGVKLFRFTNSETNDRDSEISFAEATFFSDGIVREIFNEKLRPQPQPNPDGRGQGGGGGGRNFPFPSHAGIDAPRQQAKTYLEKIYAAGANRGVDPTGASSEIGWPSVFGEILNLNVEQNPFDSLSAEQQKTITEACETINFAAAERAGIEHIPASGPGAVSVLSFEMQLVDSGVRTYEEAERNVIDATLRAVGAL